MKLVIDNIWIKNIYIVLNAVEETDTNVTYKKERFLH